jgi:NADH:ubiquinone oxidoreductase subunit C
MQNRLVINLNNIIGKYSYIINQVYYTLVLLETLKTESFFNFKNNEYFKFSVTSKNEIVLDIAVSKIQQVLIILTKHTTFRFNKLSDITVYDRPQYDMRFIINYVLGNSEKEQKIRIRT